MSRKVDACLYIRPRLIRKFSVNFFAKKMPIGNFMSKLFSSCKIVRKFFKTVHIAPSVKYKRIFGNEVLALKLEG